MSGVEMTPKVTYMFEKLALYKDVPDSDKKSKLVWAVRNSYPRMICYTNVGDSDADFFSTFIVAPFNYNNVYSVMEAITRIANSTSPNTIEINCLNTKYVDNKPTNDITVQAKVVVSRKEDGDITIGLKEEGKAFVEFSFGDPEWHSFYTKDGIKLSKGEVASMMAISYRRSIWEVLKTVLARDTINNTKQYGGEK